MKKWENAWALWISSLVVRFEVLMLFHDIPVARHSLAACVFVEIVVGHNTVTSLSYQQKMSVGSATRFSHSLITKFSFTYSVCALAHTLHGICIYLSVVLCDNFLCSLRFALLHIYSRQLCFIKQQHDFHNVSDEKHQIEIKVEMMCSRSPNLSWYARDKEHKYAYAYSVAFLFLSSVKCCKLFILFGLHFKVLAGVVLAFVRCFFIFCAAFARR